MLLNERVESKELKVLRLLNLRMDIPDEAKKRLYNLQQGLEGELKFDKASVVLTDKFLILRNLFFDFEGNKFQIDTLMIAQKCIVVCEIKYCQGNYFYQDGEFRNNITKKEINNPLHQLSRCKKLLSHLLHQHGFTLTIDGYIIFNHPEFFLYEAPRNKPIIYLPQINSFLSKLSALPSELNDGHHRIAQILLERHIPDPPFHLTFSYDFAGLRKGSCCGKCSSFLVSTNGRKLVCSQCGFEEELEKTVMRAVEELKLLFPEKKMTTSLVHEWCGVEGHRSRISRILVKHYKKIGNGRHIYFE